MSFYQNTEFRAYFQNTSKIKFKGTNVQEGPPRSVHFSDRHIGIVIHVTVVAYTPGVKDTIISHLSPNPQTLSSYLVNCPPRKGDFITLFQFRPMEGNPIYILTFLNVHQVKE